MALTVTPPVAPMLAKLGNEIPLGDDWVYEPKWDGFRAIIFKDGNDVYIQSRDLRPFNRYFPDLEPTLSTALPKSCVVDGEIVITSKSGLDFDALLMRIHPAASRVKLLAEQTPASFVAFDLLASDSTDLRDAPLTRRRTRLEKILDGAPGADLRRSLTKRGSSVFLAPQTGDSEQASAWFESFEDLGLDGVVAKKAELRYVPGERVMVKVKKQRTADCVVGGYRLSKSGDGIGSLLLGLYDRGVLQYVGHTSSFKADERRRLLAELRPLEGGKSFGGGRAPGGPSRWTGGRDVSWVPLEPKLVCEVSFDRLQGDRFRHATRFLRWRPDKKPAECTFDQILPTRRR